MRTSAEGRKFLTLHEGVVLTCYLDPVGIPTIGMGFTNRSKVLTSMVGKLKPGKTKITLKQADRVLDEMLGKEYEPPVVKGMPGAKQHEFDCGVSVCWNLGPKSLGWKWAKLWRSGAVSDAAAYLGSHYNTAAGKKLSGLVRRRKEEANLLEYGVYTGVGDLPEGVARVEHKEKPETGPDPVVKGAQEILTERGFDLGSADGWMGPKTKAAILAYQKAHPHLVNDGVLGPATLAQLRRDAAAAKTITKDVVAKIGPAVTAAGGGGSFLGIPVSWIVIGVAAVLVAGAAYILWRNRDVILRRFNSMTGKEVEV